MDQRDSYCPYLPLGELTVRGTGLTKNMGKEDPFELNSSQTLRSDAKGIVISGSYWRTWNTTTFVVVLLNFYVEQVFPLVSRCNHYDTFLCAVGSGIRWVYRLSGSLAKDAHCCLVSRKHESSGLCSGETLEPLSLWDL